LTISGQYIDDILRVLSQKSGSSEGDGQVNMSHGSAFVSPPSVSGRDHSRSSVDGFAVRANDTTGASERQPKPLVLNAEILTPGTVPAIPVLPGTATLIATGGMVPRGADAVVMVEHTDTRDQSSTTVIDVRRAVVSGQFIAFAGSDLARGETVLRAGQVLTSR
jgi:putative molybdopterin biosynthesis protein